MSYYEVVRSFGLWKGSTGPQHNYRLVELMRDRGESPFMLQWGHVDDDTGLFTVIDSRRHDEIPLDHGPMIWAHEWMMVYPAHRILTYGAALRLHARLGETYTRMCERMAYEEPRIDDLALLAAIVHDLRSKGGFDPVLDFPGIERLLQKWDGFTSHLEAIAREGNTMLGTLHNTFAGPTPVTIIGAHTVTYSYPFEPRAEIRVRVNADRIGLTRGRVIDVPAERVTLRDGSIPDAWPTLPSDAPKSSPRTAPRWLGPAERA